MVWVKLFKPTWGRIAIFIILFAIIALLDQYFLFFPNSPLTYNVFGPGAVSFFIFLVLIPYAASCIIPAFFIREFRHAKIHEFLEHHQKKPIIGGVEDSLDDYENIQNKYAKSLKKPFEEIKKEVHRSKSKPNKTKKKKTHSKTRKKKTKAKTRRRR